MSVICLEIPKLNGGSTTRKLESRDEGNRAITVSYYIVPTRVGLVGINYRPGGTRKLVAAVESEKNPRDTAEIRTKTGGI